MKKTFKKVVLYYVQNSIMIITIMVAYGVLAHFSDGWIVIGEMYHD